MGRSRTSGIVTDAGRNRIINKVHQGVRIYARLGRVTLAAAEDHLRKRIAEVEEEAKRESAARRTFGKACVRYLNEKGAKRSIDTDAYHIGLIEPWLGALELVAIHNDTPELIAFKKHRLDVDKVCPTTVKRTLEVVRHVLNLAARKWRTEDNQPWLPIAPPLLEMPKNPHARPPYPLAWDEQQLLFSWLPKHLAEMALFKVNAGTRESEVCALRWAWEQQIPELDASVFIIPGNHVKNAEDRLVVLNETARAVIDARRGEHPTHVFSYRGEPVVKMNNTAWQRGRREAAQQYEAELGRPCPPLFGKVRVHDLKHTYGRRLRSAGVSLETRKLLLGHKNGDITTHYSAAEIGELIAASNRISAAKGTPSITLLRVATEANVGEESRRSRAGSTKPVAQTG
jgi:integrase